MYMLRDFYRKINTNCTNGEYWDLPVAYSNKDVNILDFDGNEDNFPISGQIDILCS